MRKRKRKNLLRDSQIDISMEKMEQILKKFSSDSENILYNSVWTDEDNEHCAYLALRFERYPGRSGKQKRLSAGAGTYWEKPFVNKNSLF